MSYTRADVASSGNHWRYLEGRWFPRVDVNPVGAWVETDCGGSGATVTILTSAGQTFDVGPRAPDNPVCVRWVPARNAFKVAWVAKEYPSGQPVAVGRTIDFDAAGRRIANSDGQYDASGAGSQGIRDIGPDGTIYFKDQTDARTVDGQILLHWRERNGMIVGVLHGGYLGVSVYVSPDCPLAIPRGWYRASDYHLDLLPGIANNGDVAVSGADPGGLVRVADWSRRGFDPSVVPMPSVDEVWQAGRTYGTAVYAFNDVSPVHADLIIPVRPTAAGISRWKQAGHKFIATTEALPFLSDDDIWALYTGTDGHGDIAQVVRQLRPEADRRGKGIAVYDDNPDGFRIYDCIPALRPDDVVLVKMYRGHGEPDDAFSFRMSAEYDRIRWALSYERLATVPVYMVVGVHRRVDGTHPIGLTAGELANGVIFASRHSQVQWWPGVAWFAEGRSYSDGRPDCPTEVLPYLARTREGSTGRPPARDVSEAPRPSEPSPSASASPSEPPDVGASFRQARRLGERT